MVVELPIAIFLVRFRNLLFANRITVCSLQRENYPQA